MSEFLIFTDISGDGGEGLAGGKWCYGKLKMLTLEWIVYFMVSRAGLPEFPDPPGCTIHAMKFFIRNNENV